MQARVMGSSSRHRLRSLRPTLSRDPRARGVSWFSIPVYVLQDFACVVVQTLPEKEPGSGGPTTVSSSSSRIRFYNRRYELESLDKRCSAEPTAITVVLGPRSAGKSALLERYMLSISDMGLQGSRCFVDARSTAVTTPSSLAVILLESAIPDLIRQFPDSLLPAKQGLLDAIANWAAPATVGALQQKFNFGDSSSANVDAAKFVTAMHKVLAADRGRGPPLEQVLTAYSSLLDCWDKARAPVLPDSRPPVLPDSRPPVLPDGRPPVLVLDEANVLMEWGPQHEADRKTLLRFFIKVSKATNQSHVLLATSESAFRSWLAEEISSAFFHTIVIGDFPAVEARGYLDWLLQAVNKPPVSDADWGAVYKVCGGNAGALKAAVNLCHILGGWEQALLEVAKDVWGTMRAGYRPLPGAGYTAADYATAVKAILDSPYNAVDEEELTDLLGQPQPLQAIVQANQLALRPYSAFAKDINPEAFGPRQTATVVTAPSSLHLHHMQEERSMLLSPLQTQQVQPGSSGASKGSSGARKGSSSSSRPANPQTQKRLAAVAAQLAEVSDSIKAGEGNVKAVDAAISKVEQEKGDGWEVKLQRLHQERQRLASEKSQLIEGKRLLQEEKLLYLKGDYKKRFEPQVGPPVVG